MPKLKKPDEATTLANQMLDVLEAQRRLGMTGILRHFSTLASSAMERHRPR